MKPLLKRKRINSSNVIIRNFKNEDNIEFRSLNTAWISQFFEMEDADHIALDSPKDYIIDRGGYIFVASIEEQTVGVCALLKRDCQNYPYELAKMAVSETARGNGVGLLLGQVVVEKAKELGACSIYRESNTKLKPAIKLYEKLGFKKVVGHDTPYQRCNIQMEKVFN